MKINPVSFGKIIRVNAPYEIACQIADIANEKVSPAINLKRSVSALFNDTARGEARTFCFDKRISYIFSGEEGNKYSELIHSSDVDLRENIMNLINDAGTVFSVEPTYNNKMKLRSLNIKI